MRAFGLSAVAWIALLLGCSTTEQPEADLRPAKQTTADPNRSFVDRYLEAFNAHSVDQMTALMHEELEVYYVDQNGVSALGTEGRTSMGTELASYFEQLPDVASRIEGEVASSERFVSYTERVIWTQQGQTRTQAALAVLEREGDLLRRVWYYPATP